MPTTDQDTWVHATLGVHPAAYEGAPPGGGGAGSAASGGAAAPVAAAPGFLQKDFSLGIPKLPKKSYPALGGKVQIDIALEIKISGHGALDSQDSTSVNAGAIEAAAVQAARNWHSVSADPALSGGLWKNLTFKRDGLSLLATSATNTSLGTFSIEVAFVKLEKASSMEGLKASLKVLTATATLVPKSIALPDVEVAGVKLTKLKITVGASVAIAPNYFNILADLAKEQAEGVLKEMLESMLKTVGQTAGEAAAVVISVDAIVVGSLIVGGLAAVGGGIFSVIQGWGVADLAQSYAPAVQSAKAGFRAAMAGAQGPSDPFGQLGYDLGRANYQKLFDQTRQANAGATEEVIKEAITRKADQALGEVSTTIDQSIRVAMWDGYLRNNTRFLVESSARYAFVACFGYDPHFDKGWADSHWGDYVKQHPTMSKL